LVPVVLVLFPKAMRVEVATTATPRALVTFMLLAVVVVVAVLVIVQIKFKVLEEETVALVVGLAASRLVQPLLLDWVYRQ
jgi:hypothetical protein